MASQGTLRVRIVGDAGPLEKTLNGAGDKIKKFAAGMAAAGAAAVAGGVLLIEHAGRLEAVALKAGAVFEEQLGTVEQWAKANANAMGLTSSELVGLSANFADLLKPMGFTAKQAAEMSMQTNQLAGALAEWSGGQVDAAGASEVLAKAMLGERDGLKALGIAISEADVKARLAANGQSQLTGAALEQAKALATQQLIMEKSTDAQAAYAAGGDTMQRQQAVVTAAVKEFRDGALTTLMPLAQRLAEWASETLPGALETAQRFVNDRIVPAMDTMASAVGRVTNFFVEHKAVMTGVLATVGAAIAAYATATTIQTAKAIAAWVATATAATAAGTTTTLTTGQMVAKWAWLGAQSLAHAAKVAAAWVLATGPVGAIVAAVVAAAALIVLNWDKIKVAAEVVAVWVAEKWNQLVDFVAGLPGRIASAAAGMFDGIKEAYRSAINWIIGKWNSLQLTLGGATISLPFGKSFTVPSVTLSTPDIPFLADGGIVTRPTLAVIGEAGPEAVVPLSRDHGLGSSVTVNVHVDGTFNLTDRSGMQQLARAIHTEFIEEFRRSGVLFNGRVA